MAKYIDLTGRIFGYLTVQNKAENTKRGAATWVCKCQCGGRKTVRADLLVSGNTTSCGCKRNRTAAEKAKANPRAFKYIVQYNQANPGIKGVICCFARVYAAGTGLEIMRLPPCTLKVYPGPIHAMTRKVLEAFKTEDKSQFQFTICKIPSVYDVWQSWERIQREEPLS